MIVKGGGSDSSWEYAVDIDQVEWNKQHSKTCKCTKYSFITPLDFD